MAGLVWMDIDFLGQPFDMSYLVKSAVTPSEASNSSGGYAFPETAVDVVIAKKRSVAMSEFRNGRLPATLKLSGCMTTDGINYADATDIFPAKWSFGLRLYEDGDANAIDAWVEKAIDAFTLPDDLEPEDVEVLSPFKDGTIYLKCPTDADGKTFQFTTEPKLTPNKKTMTDLFREMPVDAYVTMSAYLGLPTGEKGATTGLSFKLKHLVLHTDPSAMDVDVKTEEAATQTTTTTAPVAPPTATKPAAAATRKSKKL